MPALGLSARGIVVARGLGARKNIAGELLHSGALIPLAAGILLLVLLWSLIVVQVADDLAMTKRDIIRKNDQLTRSLEEHVRSSLQAVDVELKLVAAEYRRAGLTPAVKFVMQIANENPLLLQCFILDESGRVAASTLPGAETRNYSDRSYFQVHRTKTADTLVVSPAQHFNDVAHPKALVHASDSRERFARVGTFAGRQPAKQRWCP